MRFFVIVLTLFVFSCVDKNVKEQAIGLTGKINIIMTPAHARGNIGKALDSLLTQPMTVLPRPEDIFKIRFVNPNEVNASMRRTRNLLIVFTLSDRSKDSQDIKKMLSAESLKQLGQDTSVFMRSLSDVYAKGQEVTYLFAQDETGLLKKIKKFGYRVVDNFNLKERQRITNGILNARTTKGIVQTVEGGHPFAIKVPFGYQLADDQKEFVWLRQVNPADDKDVFIASKKYASQADFKMENLIKFRDDICRQYIFEDPDQSDTYLVTETSIEEKQVVTREFNFDGRYAVEMKGLWKTNINTMGGPFVGFAFVDEARGLFYYIEGFTYSPSRDQREIMRELETVLYSFKTK